jgi:succinoglycan biosynthesis protein ExoM
MPDVPQLIVCVATTGRNPGQLEECLDSLVLQEPRPWRLALVWNSQNGFPEWLTALVSTLNVTCATELLHEPRVGIPYARNRAVDFALSLTPDFIAFVDDDGYVLPGWTSAHLTGLVDTSASVSTGPIYYLIPPSASRRLAAKARSFSAVELPDGQERLFATTGNVVVRTNVFRDVQPHFDQSLQRSGGSDVEFFRRASRLGHAIRWTSQARVVECVPAGRVKLRWLGRRQFRNGNVEARLEQRRTPRYFRLLRGFRGLSHVFGGLLQCLIQTLRRNPPGAVAGFERAAAGLGSVAASIGIAVRNYV